MSGVLDQYGSPVTAPRKWAHGATRNLYRGPSYRNRDAGVDDLIPSHDRKTLAALSRRMVFNQGPAKEALRQKASYSVGCAWLPTYHGSDTDAGREAAEWLVNVWFPVCDSSGVSDWWEFLELVSRCMDRDGEAFVLLTGRMDENERVEFPLVQLVPNYLVMSYPNTETVESGNYFGLPIEDGVITNASGRAVAYRVYKSVQAYSEAPEDADSFQDISARDLIHVFDREYPEQRRGFPAFSHALEQMKNGMNSRDLEIITQNIVSSIFLLDKGEPPSPNEPGYEASAPSAEGEAVMVESVAPGVRYVSGDAELEALKHDRPGDIWESFQDRLWREAIVGIGWAYELVWKANGQGTADRAAVVRARKAIESRQKKLKRVATRAATYALAVGDQNEALTVTAPGNMLKWGFTVPERLSVDDGRESRMMLEALRDRQISTSEYQSFRGRTAKQHQYELAMDQVSANEVAEEVSAASGVEIDPSTLQTPELSGAEIPQQFPQP